MKTAYPVLWDICGFLCCNFGCFKRNLWENLENLSNLFSAMRAETIVTAGELSAAIRAIGACAVENIGFDGAVAAAWIGGIALFAVFGDVKHRVAVFAVRVFVVIDSLHDAKDHKDDAEERKNDSHQGKNTSDPSDVRCDGESYDRPEDAEQDRDDRTDKTHFGRTAARLDAFHENTSFDFQYKNQKDNRQVTLSENHLTGAGNKRIKNFKKSDCRK